MSETYVHEPDAWLLGVYAGEITQPHAWGGWPEFAMTLRFCVDSDDPEVVADVRRRVLERGWDPGGWTRDGDPDGAAAEVDGRDPVYEAARELVGSDDLYHLLSEHAAGLGWATERIGALRKALGIDDP